MKMVEYAREELRRAGLFDPDSDYNGGIADAVLALVEVLAKQGHSGGSLFGTLAIFDKVARYQPLTPLTSDPAEWNDVSDVCGHPAWQSRRSPSVFSRDGGKTWYDLDAPADGGAA